MSNISKLTGADIVPPLNSPTAQKNKHDQTKISSSLSTNRQQNTNNADRSSYKEFIYKGSNENFQQNNFPKVVKLVKLSPAIPLVSSKQQLLFYVPNSITTTKAATEAAEKGKMYVEKNAASQRRSSS